MNDQELQSLRNMGNECEAAADEIERLRVIAREAAEASTKHQAEVLRLRAALVPLSDSELPPNYMLAKLQMVMPLFQEARYALKAITEAQRRQHSISAFLANRMDAAGMFSLDDWQRAHGIKGGE